LHCPVFIGPPAARASQGTIMVSGPHELFDAVRSDLSRMAARLEYFGERPDLAAVFKLCGNAFIVGINALVADVFAIASASRVASADALRVIEFFSPATVVTARGNKIVSGDFTPTFQMGMARKDVKLMLKTARSLP